MDATCVQIPALFCGSFKSRRIQTLSIKYFILEKINRILNQTRRFVLFVLFRDVINFIEVKQSLMRVRVHNICVCLAWCTMAIFHHQSWYHNLSILMTFTVHRWQVSKQNV